jgi:hypothetical protein
MYSPSIAKVEVQIQEVGQASMFSRPTQTPLSWRERAFLTYYGSRQEKTRALKQELLRRIMRLTGRRPSLDKIYADLENRSATVSEDNTLFRLEDDTLTVVRPCAYCGTGQFKSPSIRDAADLGYALSVWQPLHSDCTPDETTSR